MKACRTCSTHRCSAGARQLCRCCSGIANQFTRRELVQEGLRRDRTSKKRSTARNWPRAISRSCEHPTDKVSAAQKAVKLDLIVAPFLPQLALATNAAGLLQVRAARAECEEQPLDKAARAQAIYVQGGLASSLGLEVFANVYPSGLSRGAEKPASFIPPGERHVMKMIL